MSFEPRTRLEKILMKIPGVNPITRLENAVKYAVDNSGGGGGALYELTGTFGKDDDKDTITIDKTASELFDALKNGAFVKFIVELEAAGVKYRNDVIGFVSSGKVAGENGINLYSFAFFTSDGKFMVCDNASGTDTVVFTEV